MAGREVWACGGPLSGRGRLQFLTMFLLCHSLLLGATGAKKLTASDEVSVTMNKVWPYHNPMETYSYYLKLPVCHPGNVEAQHATLGQILRGDRLVNSLYSIKFLADAPETPVCTKMIESEDELKQFWRAIDEKYMFEVYVADLPINKPVGFKAPGEDSQERYYLATLWNFELGHNKNQVVSANMSVENGLTDITEYSEGMVIEFKYSVTWRQSEISPHSRLTKQLAGALTPSTHSLDIHWLAIINSFVLVLFIVSLLLLIVLRVVRSDLSKYLRIPDEELAAGMEEESGWKLLRADVFRPPPHRMWFCACVGSGAHLLLVVMTVVLVGCFTPYVERGTVLSSGLLGYLMTSFIAGFFSANLYKRLGGEKWAWNILITALMFMGPFFVVWSCLNTIAIAYASTAALPFSTACLLFACWFFITLPLTVLGGIVGRRRAAQWAETGAAFPCKTNKLAREIPSVSWYHSPWMQVLGSGLLPFSAIYIELHYVFGSIWGTRIYTLYGVLLLAFAMLLFVAMTVSILLTYFHLNAEDHRWWWRALCTGGSVSIFFYGHCLYYFFTTARIYGALQVAFFFGYSFVVALGLFLTLGFATFCATYLFVHQAYSSIKSD